MIENARPLFWGFFSTWILGFCLHAMLGNKKYSSEFATSEPAVGEEGMHWLWHDHTRVSSCPLGYHALPQIHGWAGTVTWSIRGGHSLSRGPASEKLTLVSMHKAMHAVWRTHPGMISDSNVMGVSLSLVEGPKPIFPLTSSSAPRDNSSPWCLSHDFAVLKCWDGLRDLYDTGVKPKKGMSTRDGAWEVCPGQVRKRRSSLLLASSQLAPSCHTYLHRGLGCTVCLHAQKEDGVRNS